MNVRTLRYGLFPQDDLSRVLYDDYIRQGRRVGDAKGSVAKRASCRMNQRLVLLPPSSPPCHAAPGAPSRSGLATSAAPHRCPPRRGPWPGHLGPHRLIRAARLRLNTHAHPTKLTPGRRLSARVVHPHRWLGTCVPARVLLLHDSTTLCPTGSASRIACHAGGSSPLPIQLRFAAALATPTR